MTSALSRSTENMAFLRKGLEDVWSLIPACASKFGSFGQRGERLSDGYFILYCYYRVYVTLNNIFSYTFSCSNFFTLGFFYPSIDNVNRNIANFRYMISRDCKLGWDSSLSHFLTVGLWVTTRSIRGTSKSTFHWNFFSFLLKTAADLSPHPQASWSSARFVATCR